MPDKLNIATALASFDETWSPRIAAEVDGFEVKLVKLHGDFVWHHHDDADELFWVLEGRLLMRFQDRDDVWLEPGELLVIPRGVEHLPSAPDGCSVALLERAGVVNTGSAGGDRTATPVPLDA